MTIGQHITRAALMKVERQRKEAVRWTAEKCSKVCPKAQAAEGVLSVAVAHRERVSWIALSQSQYYTMAIVYHTEASSSFSSFSFPQNKTIKSASEIISVIISKSWWNVCS